jgi:hypothetical protein
MAAALAYHGKPKACQGRDNPVVVLGRELAQTVPPAISCFKRWTKHQTWAAGVFFSPANEFGPSHERTQPEKLWSLRRCQDSIVLERPSLARGPTRSQFPHLERGPGSPPGRGRNLHVHRWQREALACSPRRRHLLNRAENPHRPTATKQWVHGRITVVICRTNTRQTDPVRSSISPRLKPAVLGPCPSTLWRTFCPFNESAVWYCGLGPASVAGPSSNSVRNYPRCVNLFNGIG